MAFYKNPIFEEPPRCLVCSVVVTDGSFVCSATCEDIQAYGGHVQALSDTMMEDDCYA